MTPAERERGRRLAECRAAFEGVPVVWGESDCSTWPASWVSDILGQPVMFPAFSTKEEAEAMIAEAGGLVPLWDEVAASVGLRRRSPGEWPLVGDVGVVRMTYSPPVGGIFSNGGVFNWRREETEKHAAGVHVMSVRLHTILACWEVPL